MTLPETWQFLGPWWWVLHIVAIALVFWCGYLIGRHSTEESQHPHHHHHHHSHESHHHEPHHNEHPKHHPPPHPSHHPKPES